MVRLRGLGRNRDPTAPAMKAVADQCLPLEVSLTWPPTIWEDKRGLPFVVFQVRLFGAGLIRLWRRVVIRRRRVLEVGQSTVLVNTDGVPPTVSAETLGSRYVFLPAYRSRRDPVSVVVQPVGNLREVVGNLEVVRPATNGRVASSREV